MSDVTMEQEECDEFPCALTLKTDTYVCMYAVTVKKVNIDEASEPLGFGAPPPWAANTKMKPASRIWSPPLGLQIHM